MKPRLDSAPLTSEDWDILFHGYPYPLGTMLATERVYWWGVLAGTSNRQDCRDADLMLWLTQLQATPEEWREWNLPAALERPTPLAHVLVKMDPEWPIGHYIISCA